MWRSLQICPTLGLAILKLSLSLRCFWRVEYCQSLWEYGAPTVTDYQHMSACMLGNGDRFSPAASGDQTEQAGTQHIHTNSSCPSYSAMQLLSKDDMPKTLPGHASLVHPDQKARVHPTPVHTHACWTREKHDWSLVPKTWGSSRQIYKSSPLSSCPPLSSHVASRGLSLRPRCSRTSRSQSPEGRQWQRQ